MKQVWDPATAKRRAPRQERHRRVDPRPGRRRGPRRPRDAGNRRSPTRCAWLS